MNRDFLARWGWRRYARSVAFSRARRAGLHVVRVVSSSTDQAKESSLPPGFSLQLDTAAGLQQLSPEIRAEMDLSDAFLERASDHGFDAVGLRDRRGLVACNWFVRNHVAAPVSPSVDVVVTHADCAYGFKTFVRPDARGKGLGPHLLSGRNLLLRDLGITRVLGYIDPDNFASLRGYSKIGGTPVGWAGYNVGPFGLRRFRTEGAKKAGFQFVPARPSQPER
jgi:GNAT superfamily N-acetyltransferase